jgi:4'-phosphopantetheinyl transferase superfamily
MKRDDWRPPPNQLVLEPGHVHVWRAATPGRDDARAILKTLLGRYEDRDPTAVELTQGPHGKPELKATTDLRFNMSHTKGLALYAFARGSEVGVDVERPRRSLDTVRMARRFIGAAEADRLGQLGPDERDAAFLHAWVRYEATVKCLGTGIGGRNIQRAAADKPPWIMELDPGPSAAAAAVAVADGPSTLHLYEWATTAEP